MRDIEMEEPEPGPGYDRLDTGDHSGVSWRAHRLPIAVAGLTIVAVVLGALAGSSWGRNDEKQRQSSLAQSTLAVSAVVAPRSDAAEPQAEGSVVTQRVDLAVVNGASLPLTNVTVSWDKVHTSSTGEEEEQAALDELAPQSPQPVSLLLRNTCGASATSGSFETPRVVVTATTSDGTRHKTTIDPLGIDQVWSGMAAACPGQDETALTNVRLVSDVPLGDRTTRFTLRFSNASSTDVFINDVTLNRGFNKSAKQRPAPLQVFPHYSATLVIDLTINSCQSAIEDISPTTIDFAVSSADNPDRVRNVSATDATYSEAVGRLVYRACARK
jgi:hypothetical protein